MKPLHNIAAKAAETILAKPITITIGTDEYQLPRPTIRTLIQVSGEIAKLPTFTPQEKKEFVSTLAYAKHATQIGNIIATMLCGANACFWKRERMARRILNRYTPTELLEAVTQLFVELDIQGFFGLTTSLNEINLVKPTKEVV